MRVKPTEVFGNPDAALLGFPVLAPRYAAEEARFGVRRDPAAQELVAALVSSPPQTIAQASKVFAYLSGQVGRASSHLRPVRALELIRPTPCRVFVRRARRAALGRNRSRSQARPQGRDRPAAQPLLQHIRHEPALGPQEPLCNRSRLWPRRTAVPRRLRRQGFAFNVRDRQHAHLGPGQNLRSCRLF